MKEQELIRAEFEKVYLAGSFTSELHLSRSDGEYDNPFVRARWNGYLSASTPLLERIALLQKDADRYRFLRDSYRDSPVSCWEELNSRHIAGDDLDTAIDTAIQHKEQTDGN